MGQWEVTFSVIVKELPSAKVQNTLRERQVDNQHKKSFETKTEKSLIRFRKDGIASLKVEGRSS